MKQIVLILMSILSFSCSSQTQRQATDVTEPVGKKILVAYFSCTGTTGRVEWAKQVVENGKKESR